MGSPGRFAKFPKPADHRALGVHPKVCCPETSEPFFGIPTGFSGEEETLVLYSVDEEELDELPDFDNSDYEYEYDYEIDTVRVTAKDYEIVGYEKTTSPISLEVLF